MITIDSLERSGIKADDAVNDDSVSGLSPEDQLRASAKMYLNNAIERGEVRSSRWMYVQELGMVAGYTAVEAESGVEIVRWSNGSYRISAGYHEQQMGANVGDYQDLEVTVVLPVNGWPDVTERRHKVVDHEKTLDCGSKTLSSRDRADVMARLAKEIFLVY